ncbi:hypothetical protein [Micromonospora matsumotoense]|uniref:hypothetical protein n=1 Tax=Micromonospora matsumotoense TaxID=121616 RepID=UPI0033DCDEBF
MNVDPDVVGGHVNVDREAVRRARFWTRPRMLGVVVVMVGVVASGVVLVVATLLVRLFGGGLSAGVRMVIITVSVVAGAGLAGWSTRAALGSALARLVGDRGED